MCGCVLQEGKDWMLQLLSVACISLAAKMEESEVPMLLDLQVGCLSRIAFLRATPNRLL